MPTTLKDVARAAGVSAATVSRVLGEKPGIHVATRKKVLAAVQELGYSPNRTARSLRTQRSQIIGVVVSDIQYDFFPPVVRGIEKEVASEGFAMLLFNSDEDPVREAQFARLLVEENAAGAIVAPTGLDGTSLEVLGAARVPIVTIDRLVRDVETDSVVVDNVRAAHALTSHLLEQGFRRIAAILGNPAASTARDRYVGFRDAMGEHGLEPDPELVRSGGPSRDAGRSQAQRLLDLAQPPDAIVTSNHLLASGAYDVIRERRLRIPQDVALATFDDPLWTSYVEPAVTVVAQPAFDIGREAGRLLLQRFGAPDGPKQHLVLPTELVVRGSSLLRPAAQPNPHTDTPPNAPAPK